MSKTTRAVRGQALGPCTVEVELLAEFEADSWEAEGQLRQLVVSLVERELGAGRYSIALHLVDDAEIRRLNRELRGKDSHTDVLSFPLHEPGGEGFVTPPELPVALGDVVVSRPRAMAQAEEYGHSYQRELAFLVAHGVLHVLGHDHEEGGQQRLMRQREEEALAPLGFTRF